jgi:hypothetical protein
VLKFLVAEIEERVYRRVLDHLLRYRPKESQNAFRLAVILSAAEIADALDVLGDPKQLYSIDAINEMHKKLAVAQRRLTDALEPGNQPPRQ